MCRAFQRMSGGIGGAPIDLRLSFWRHRKAVRAAARAMIGWAPERIVIAHGRCSEKDAVRALQRAFRWVLRRHLRDAARVALTGPAAALTMLSWTVRHCANWKLSTPLRAKAAFARRRGRWACRRWR
jgi:hypothetical protein